MSEDKSRLIQLTLGFIRIGYWSIFVLTFIMLGSPFITSTIFTAGGIEALPSMSDPDFIIMSINGFLHCVAHLLAAGVLFIVHEIGTKLLLLDENPVKNV